MHGRPGQPLALWFSLAKISPCKTHLFTKLEMFTWPNCVFTYFGKEPFHLFPSDGYQSIWKGCSFLFSPKSDSSFASESSALFASNRKLLILLLWQHSFGITVALYSSLFQRPVCCRAQVLNPMKTILSHIYSIPFESDKENSFSYSFHSIPLITCVEVM